MAILSGPEEFLASVRKLTGAPDSAETAAAVTMDARLSDLGIGSMAFLDWFYSLQDSYGVQFGDEVLFEVFGDAVRVGDLYRNLSGLSLPAPESS
jgi:acyl carrier protein